MPREARLFEAAGGSPGKALLRLQGNIPPNWISRARGSRKSIEPDIVAAMTRLKRLRVERPKAAVLIKSAERELRELLKAWDLAYNKETFYHGLRCLLELSRTGRSPR